MEVRPPRQPVLEPKAWREALSPMPGASPVVSRTVSKAGSQGSGRSTPRSATPPLSQHGNSARSSHSGLSARSGGSARGGGGCYFASAVHEGYSARSALSGFEYCTPDPSARSSDFASVYDAASSQCPSARTFASAMDHGLGGNVSPLDQVSRRSRQSTGNSELAEPSMDPQKVFSSARHGKHKDVEASLQAGFDPQLEDSFGNTIFHVACQNGNKRIAKAAIKYGGNMDAQNGKGNTGLHFLYAYGYPDIAEYFIEKGAGEDVANCCGNVPREGIK